MNQPKVLIVGAGPTGLVLALRLAAHGVAFRIIEKNAGPGLASRALALHARTLEFYDQLGIIDEVIALGQKLQSVNFRKNGRKVATLNLSNMGAGLSPYPFIVGFPQDDHEKFLVEKLRAKGVDVEWDTELLEFEQDDEGVSATICKQGLNETLHVAYLSGCDGARSKVREILNAEFQGGTYQHLYWVADVQLDDQQNKEGHVSVNSEGFVLMMPVRSNNMQRLIGILPDRADSEPKATFEDVRPFAEYQLNIKIKEVNWFSTYHAHHRVASHFRLARCFILGDAGHIHSPVGGQGMNTGIGDAINLSWKLAYVLQGRVAVSLLDSFETERIAFAKLLVSTTDKAFLSIISKGFDGSLLRGVFLPYVLPFLTWFSAIRRFIFRTVSQTKIQYNDSAISEGQAGRIKGGDRMPWVPSTSGGNFDALRSMDWQIHVYGEIDKDLHKICDTHGLDLRRFGWDANAKKASIEKNSTFLIRPDGYVAIASLSGMASKLETYIAKWSLDFSQADLNLH